jgi:hypothetical protein
VSYYSPEKQLTPAQLADITDQAWTATSGS